jgi:phosphate transport system substrate-binding protein
MNGSFKIIGTFIFSTMVLAGCQNRASDSGRSFTTGTTRIVVDESFKPIVEDQLQVFEAQYPTAKIEPVYKSENELLKLFLSDSIRIAVVSRQLRPEESKFYENKQINIRVRRFAVDAVALITHKSVTDSTVTVQDVIDVLHGKPGKLKALVFDNPNSSTVNYFKQLANVQELPSTGVYGMKSNPEVIRYVHDHPGTVGVIGVNWIKQPDPELVPLVNNLRTLAVKNLPGKPGSDNFYKPTQSNIALKLYPFMRNLYIMNGQGGPGLGSGFAAFLYGEQGQRIVLKSGLLPDSLPPREVRIKK